MKKLFFKYVLFACILIPANTVIAKEHKAEKQQDKQEQEHKTKKKEKGKEEKKEEKEEKINYKPQIEGAVKAKVEISTYTGEHRFNVRNSRFGIFGNITRQMAYKIQVDFSNEGKISILDSYAEYKLKSFSLRLGQQQYSFSTDLSRGPSTNMFANRSFISKYITSYYGEEISNGKITDVVKTIGSRDIGALFSYKPTELPLAFYAGIFNGSGINNPEWSDNVNFVAKIVAGKDKGFGAAVSYYGGRTPNHSQVITKPGNILETETCSNPLEMVGAELRYAGDRYLIEAEYAQRWLQQAADHVITAAHVQGYYKFPLPKNIFADHIAPIARWDMGDNIDYLNLDTKRREAFSANRITAGVNIGLAKKLLRSEIRLNYEKYFLKKRPSDFSTNPLLQDKFTIEIVAAF